MEQQLAALYNKLAKHIVAMIPVKWDTFHYLGEVERGNKAIPRCSIFVIYQPGSLLSQTICPKSIRYLKAATWFSGRN